MVHKKVLDPIKSASVAVNAVTCSRVRPCAGQPHGLGGNGPFINTVTYTTVLQGFAMARRAKDVFSTYEEMKHRGISLNTVTFNTMLDACAKCNAIHRASSLVDEMRQAAVGLGLITYTTLVKGYCCEGDPGGVPEHLACPSASALIRGLGQHKCAFEPLACSSASARAGACASMSLPWSLSRVHPRALGQEGQHEFALEPLACPSASVRVRSPA